MFNCILPISTHTQRFGLTVSFRRKILTLRQLYPRVPSQPSVLPCRMGRTSTSTTLMTQLVQAAILPPHVMLENIYIIDQNFCSFLNQIIFLVQYNFGKVRFTDLSEESIHLRVQRNSLLFWKGLLIQVADDASMFERIKFNLF